MATTPSLQTILTSASQESSADADKKEQRVSSCLVAVDEEGLPRLSVSFALSLEVEEDEGEAVLQTGDDEVVAVAVTVAVATSPALDFACIDAALTSTPRDDRAAIDDCSSNV